METKEYRKIEFQQGACPICDEVVGLRLPQSRRQRPALFAHGPRDNRCAGSGGRPVPWVEASRLPSWEQMSELDQGAALLHVWKRYREGTFYARDNYPVRYIEDEVLRGLDRVDGSRHAWLVTGGWIAVNDRLGSDEVDRLYNLALDAERSEVAV